MIFLTDNQIKEYETKKDLIHFLESIGDADLVLNAKGHVHVKRLLRDDDSYKEITDVDYLKSGFLRKYKGVRIWHSFYKDRILSPYEKCEPYNQYEETGVPSL